MENLFYQIRGKNYQSNNPSAQEFRLIIRQILVDSLTIHNREANCEEDIDFLLFNSSNISKIKCLRKEEKNKIRAVVYEMVYIYIYIYIYIYKYINI